ncbi:MAG: NosD domain-containing protein [Candidatus Heimdallarchaeaceae archaeon]
MAKKPAIKNKFFSVSLLILLILFTLFFFTDSTNFSLKGSDMTNKETLNYTTHDPILIDSSDDFTTYGFTGTGGSSTPYLIANYSITNGADYSIKITNVNDYFIIENCYTEYSLHGIDVLNVGTGRAIVRNNTCIDHTFGIYIESSSQSQVLNNSISDTEWAISVDFSGGSTIQNNTCTSAFMGIASYTDGTINIVNNTLSDSLVGMYVEYTDQATITGNILINNGLFLDFNSADDYSTLTFSDNTINSKPIAIIFNQLNQYVDAASYGQVIVLNSSRILVNDSSVIPVPVYGVHVFFSDRCEVSDIVIKNNMYCIWAYYAPDIEINDVTCSNDYYALDALNKDGNAIQAKYSNDTIIIDSICENYGVGISIVRSFSSAMIGNTCDNNDRGITIYAQNCWVEDNVLNLNFEGIVGMGSGTLNVTWNEILGNTITGCTTYGISLYPYTKNNKIHHNILVDNAISMTSQAYDVGEGNVWYDTSNNQGNYWSNWVSGPYSIDGSAGSEDPYPLGSISEFSTGTAILFALLISCIAIIPLIKKRR